MLLVNVQDAENVRGLDMWKSIAEPVQMLQQGRTELVSNVEVLITSATDVLT
jgi:hypothetical protein